ncbi:MULTISPECIES: hypothetical protein [unclassified Spirosoma]|uniref:hypothetical protein n=1 Tax=unclassified Spirosoma TaxID=2621999 RepID=UPI00095AEA25|nr:MULTISPECIES: hypothetical protein [unclassified Spirosoma]MBN8825926.1 hypothetical protein [Spirosoma sp.]OJW70964.1 MAG: hypothetical protein BGO59_32615 [Spirosoma sp. 48-14]
MNQVISYGILCEDRAHKNFIEHYLNQCHPNVFQQNDSFGWQIKASNAKEVEDALPDASRQAFTKFNLDILFVGRDADSVEIRQIDALKVKLTTLCRAHSRVIFMIPVQCIEHWLLYLQWRQQNTGSTKNEPLDHIARHEAKAKIYGGKLRVEKQLEKANEILVDLAADWLESRSGSFKHFHKQVVAFLDNYTR